LPAQIVVRIDNRLFVGIACYSREYRLTAVSSKALRKKKTGDNYEKHSWTFKIFMKEFIKRHANVE